MGAVHMYVSVSGRLRNQPMRPVTIQRKGQQRIVEDVENAVDFLLVDWPSRYADTPLHHSARRAALDLMNTHIPVEAFRTAFIAAARDAGVLVE